MRILITAGPTREPIDAVRYLGNRSSGRMGAALIAAAIAAGHRTTAILGPGVVEMPKVRRIDVETAGDMLAAVRAQFPRHDLLIMAAAVADYRPKSAAKGKIPRRGRLKLELEPTEDIVALAGKMKRPNQRTVGFSLESGNNIARARRKMDEKHLDLIVLNSTETLGSKRIRGMLIYPDGRIEKLKSLSKENLAKRLIERCLEMFLTAN